MGAEIIPFVQQAAGDWWGPITTVVAIASVLCPILPVPSNPALKIAYKVVQILAANVGKAKNAQDVKK